VLRAISILTSQGYWSEAEILFRALLETKVLLMYILEEKNNKRAGVWLKRSNPKERWPWSEISSNFKEIYGSAYEQLSLYPHNHPISVERYLDFEKDGSFMILKGPLGGDKNNNKARDLTGKSAMMVGAIAELTAHQFLSFPNWVKSHEEMMKMEYFKEQASSIERVLNDSKYREALEKAFDVL
jgi:hypothetical protein